jgi:GTP pyrophosphokinase
MESLPPWLQRFDTYTQEDAMIHLDWLEYALLEEHFSFDAVEEIIIAVRVCSRNQLSTLVGMIDFLRLILQVKEPTQDFFVTKQVLLASALHFRDCITARETGVYEMIKGAIYGKQSNGYPLALPFSYQPVPTFTSDDDISTSSLTLAPASPTKNRNPTDYGDEVRRISRGAARVKRAEILAHAVLDVGRIPSKEESSRLRGLLLSVMDDWRALSIRAVACLYRLEGILHNVESGSKEYVDLTEEVVKVTREALHVYAPLAQRLGMQRLKDKLEDRAFRIMYRRQYQAVSSIYRENEEEMLSVSSNLSFHIEQVLRQNPSLIDQLEDLKVTSRVKEPYSLWKKLLKLRARKLKLSSSSLVGSTESSSKSSELSLLDVNDGIAVRIILRARKCTPDEPEETTRARERLMCYYVQQLLRNYWPTVDKRRVKDYIQFPKSNGYQSLHYTSSIDNDGLTWPFEVQVRSEEMHRIAEYGVAAHWDYKMGNKRIELLSPSASLPRLESREDENGKDPYIDALVTAREDLVQQKVFVFFAGSPVIEDVGQLLSLPVGAKVSDALDELKEQLDADLNVQVSDGSVLRNGRVAKADEYVGNGDVLLITL